MEDTLNKIIIALRAVGVSVYDTIPEDCDISECPVGGFAEIWLEEESAPRGSKPQAQSLKVIPYDALGEAACILRIDFVPYDLLACPGIGLRGSVDSCTLRDLIEKTVAGAFLGVQD